MTSTRLARRAFIASVGLGVAALPALTRWTSADTTSEILLSGRHDARLNPLDDLMTGFLKKHQLPGASLAVGRSGRVLYARGFGWADVEAKKPVQPDSQFRLASISKPITAVAMMQVVEQGGLTLDAPVMPLLR